MNTEDDEFKRILYTSGWRKRQVQAVVEDDDDIQDYKKPWVGLTDEEIEELRLKTFDAIATNYEVYRTIEAKLKEKNS